MTAHRPLLPVLCFVAFAISGFALLPGRVALPVQAQAGCTELIADGGFETGGAWQLGNSPVPPQYEGLVVHSGSHALQLGIVGAPNVQSYSSARQTVTIPADAAQATLAFWSYSVVQGAAGSYYAEAVLLAPNGYNILKRLWNSTSDSQAWTQSTFDVTGWKGQTVQIYFNVYNDGAAGTMGVYLDDVSLQSCNGTVSATLTGTGTTSSTVTPSDTPMYVVATSTNTPYYIVATVTNTPVTPIVVTPTPVTPVVVTVTSMPSPSGSPIPGPIIVTPTPMSGTVAATAMPSPAAPVANCVDLLVNGGFEQGLNGWTRGKDAILAGIVTGPVHSGAYAVRLGTDSSSTYSYSSIRQPVTIPAGSGQVTLEFWTNTWTDGAPGNDHQEAVFLNPDPTVIEKVWRVLSNDRVWVQHTIPVSGYQGRAVQIYFNAVTGSGGGHTGMYLDDVHLWVCGQQGGVVPIPGPITGGGPSVVQGQSAVVGQVQSIVQYNAAPVVVLVITPVVVTATPEAGTSVAQQVVTPARVTVQAGLTQEALPMTATITPTPSPVPVFVSPTPAPGATSTPASTPVASFWSSLGAAVREATPAGPWLAGFVVLVLAILGVIALVRGRGP